MDFICKKCGMPIEDIHDAVINALGVFHKDCCDDDGVPLWCVLLEYSIQHVSQDEIETCFREVVDCGDKRVLAL